MEKSAHSDAGELIAKCDETKEKNVWSSTREAHALLLCMDGIIKEASCQCQ